MTNDQSNTMTVRLHVSVKVIVSQIETIIILPYVILQRACIEYEDDIHKRLSAGSCDVILDADGSGTTETLTRAEGEQLIFCSP
jgi:hypothetical protein